MDPQHKGSVRYPYQQSQEIQSVDVNETQTKLTTPDHMTIDLSGHIGEYEWRYETRPTH